MAFIDGSVVNVALPVIQRDLGATASDVQWIVETYALFLAALILVEDPWAIITGGGASTPWASRSSPLPPSGVASRPRCSR